MAPFFDDIISLLFFVMDFKDPASLYIESLISVHNNVMWYLVIIITIVYWTLYKIIQDSNWTVFNKQVGFLRNVFFNKYYLMMQFLFLSFYEVICASIASTITWVAPYIQYYYFSQNPGGIIKHFDYLKNLDYFFKFFFYSFDHAIFEEISENSVRGFLGGAIREKFTSKTLDQLLFKSTNWGYFYFGRVSNFNSLYASRYSPFLTVQQFKHSTLLEVIWATFPSIVILLILVPSILLIYSIDEDLDPEFTIKIIGHQWFWSYEFDGWLPMSDLDFKDPKNTLLAQFSLDDPVLYNRFEFDSCMVITDSLNLGEHRLLEVDNPLVVPCSVGLRFLITSADVLHAWAIPELGIKVDAVPGRLSQFISMVRRPGVFFGQCSEICGVAHAFMPIVIHAQPYLNLLSTWSNKNQEIVPVLPPRPRSIDESFKFFLENRESMSKWRHRHFFSRTTRDKFFKLYWMARHYPNRFWVLRKPAIVREWTKIRQKYAVDDIALAKRISERAKEREAYELAKKKEKQEKQDYSDDVKPLKPAGEKSEQEKPEKEKKE